jgi:hypothetical protein
MNAIEFNKYWESNFSEALPINYMLKWTYPERWFRIHSLPESKRYADNEEEYKIILSRQNELICDLVDENSPVLISFGIYTQDPSNENYEEINDFDSYKKTQSIDLHEVMPDEYEKEDNMFFDVYFKTAIWKRNSHNQLLKKIADGEIRAMIICPSTNRIISPYDGGVDIICESESVKNQFKPKYTSWLSPYEDGM